MVSCYIKASLVMLKAVLLVWKAENNTLTTHATGAFLYVNNTTAEVDLSNNVISMPNTSTLVKAAADSRWGKNW